MADLEEVAKAITAAHWGVIREHATAGEIVAAGRLAASRAASLLEVPNPAAQEAREPSAEEARPGYYRRVVKVLDLRGTPLASTIQRSLCRCELPFDHDENGERVTS